MSTVSKGNDESIVVPQCEVKRFLVECLVKSGAVESHAKQLADVVVAGDLRGHYSHGLNRLDMYMNELKAGVCVGHGDPVILQEKPATAWVDGKDLLGPVVGNFCMDLAIKKAKEVGIGWVVAKRSNHFGIVGWYSMRAAEQGLVGMAFTNSSPLMFPTRSKNIALGTNPLSLAACGENGDKFVLDMASTTVALGKVEMADRKGLDIPLGWAADEQGKETTDPQKVLENGGLLPLAGAEITSGYKGYGLAAMVEILCGISAGSDWGLKVRSWKDAVRKGNLGQCFIAMDPTSFAPGFENRTQELMDSLRSLPPIDPSKPVLVAGDPEREHEALCDRLGGIPYHPNQITHAAEIAAKLGVRPMKTL